MLGSHIDTASTLLWVDLLRLIMFQSNVSIHGYTKADKTDLCIIYLSVTNKSIN